MKQDKQRLTVDVPSKQREELRRLAAASDLSEAQLVRRGIRHVLAIAKAGNREAPDRPVTVA